MSKYTLTSKPFPPLNDAIYAHKGTGNHSASSNVIQASSVTHNVADPFEVQFGKWDITVLSLEIATTEAPNWFGVSFRKGISTFDTVNIFCHPHPGGVHMDDGDYASRSGNWPRLFRYAEMFGRQIAIAGANHITIVPFFTNASYGSTGLFGANWKDIVERAVAIVKASARTGAVAPAGANGARSLDTPVEGAGYRSGTYKKGTAPPPPPIGAVRNVVLSDFSHGRVLMGTVRSQAKGMGNYLKEIWDFDGVHAATPVSGAGVKAIVYNKSHQSNPEIFPVPPERWIKYHKRVLPDEAIHGDIPAMLAVHAATISRVGH